MPTCWVIRGRGHSNRGSEVFRNRCATGHGRQAVARPLRRPSRMRRDLHPALDVSGSFALRFRLAPRQPNLCKQAVYGLFERPSQIFKTSCMH